MSQLKKFLLLSMTCFVAWCPVKALGNDIEEGVKELKSLPFFGAEAYTLHKNVSRNLLYVTNRVDSFFGNTKSLYVDNGTNLRLYNIVTKDEAQDVRNEFNFRLDLSFPNLEDKLKLTLEKKGDTEESSTPTTEGSLPTEGERDDKSLRGGVSFFIRKVLDFDFKVSAGVEIGIPPTPYVEMRLNRNWTFKKWKMRYFSNTFWNLDQGFGQSVSLDFDRSLTDKLLFRLVNDSTWLDSNDTIVTSHGPTLFHQLSDRRFISYNARANFENRPTFVIRDYVLSVVYRQKIIEDVVFYEISPRLVFPKADNFDEFASIAFKVELIF